MATFPLKILTPDGVAYDGPAVSVSCRTINGQVQLLAKHIDFCTALGMGEAHIKLEDGTTRRAACMGGMLSMLKGECRLLATTFEWADAIDAERAARSKTRAEEMLAQKNLDKRDMELAEARLKRALVRSSVADPPPALAFCPHTQYNRRMNTTFIYIIIMNIIGFCLMGLDKHRARTRQWRIPEKVLFGAALLGGSAGAWAGMYAFRHKTRRWYFVVGMPLILAVQTGLLWYFLR